MPPVRTRSLLAIAASAIAIAGLAACTPQAAPEPEPSTSAPVAEPSPSATPTPTATEEPPTPVDLSCDELLPPQTVYDYNPNFGWDAGYEPEAGSDAESVVTHAGVACSWLNQTSGEHLSVAVAQLPESQLTALKNSLVQTSNSVPTYGDEAYFEQRDGLGDAQVFSGPYWIVSTSEAYFEPGDATPIIEAVIAALP